MADQKTIISIIFVVFAGICYGIFYSYYHRRLVGDLIRAILSKNAASCESAVTLDDIGYSKGIKGIFANFVLKKGSSARKFVYTVYEEKAPVKKHDDELFTGKTRSVNGQKYYIPEEKRYTVEVKYDGKGMSLAAVLISIAVFFAAAVVAVSLLPFILAMINNLGGNSKDAVNPNEIPQSETQIEFETEFEAEAETETESDTESSKTDAPVQTISPFASSENEINF